MVRGRANACPVQAAARSCAAEAALMSHSIVENSTGCSLHHGCHAAMMQSQGPRFSANSVVVTLSFGVMYVHAC